MRNPAGEISGDRHGPKAHEMRLKMVEIMTCLLIGKHFWIALVLATLLLIVIAPLRIRRSAPHRFAPIPARNRDHSSNGL